MKCLPAAQGPRRSLGLWGLTARGAGPDAESRPPPRPPPAPSAGERRGPGNRTWGGGRPGGAISKRLRAKLLLPRSVPPAAPPSTSGCSSSELQERDSPDTISLPAGSGRAAPALARLRRPPARGRPRAPAARCPRSALGRSPGAAQTPGGRSSPSARQGRGVLVPVRGRPALRAGTAQPRRAAAPHLLFSG